jgi:hypothetical protein
VRRDALAVLVPLGLAAVFTFAIIRSNEWVKQSSTSQQAGSLAAEYSSSASSPDSGSPIDSVNTSESDTSKPSCEMLTTTEKLATNGGTVEFPKTGRFVIESHLMSNQEKYSGGDGFPTTKTEGIEEHLALHCAFLAKFGADCNKVYDSTEDDGEPFKRVWTGAENDGVIGQGSESILPTIEQESFVANLPWKSHHPSVPAGDKWIMRNPANGKAVIVAMGLESGPTSSPKYLGGAQPAVHYFLDATGSTLLTLGRAKDQDLPYGPVSCQ